jgi:prolyl oligopeptidase
MQKEDPFEWLEEVEGEKALKWAAGESALTLEELSADPRFAVIEEASLDILNDEARIPYAMPRAGRDGAFVYNFWQDGAHVRGIWRRSPLAAYAAGEPVWDTVLNIDALAQAEDENWIWQGAVSRAPDHTRALISLSRGGKDASVVREFDVTSRQFVEGGFYLAEAKSICAWMGPDTILVRTDFGEGSLTTSGYGRIAKLWQRGTELADAQTIVEGSVDDTGMFPQSVYVSGRHMGFINRWKTFFEYEPSLLIDGQCHRLPLPPKFHFYGVCQDEIIVLLGEDWEAGGKTWNAGALVSFSLQDFVASRTIARVSLVHEPGSRSAIDFGGIAKTGVYLVTLDNVIGKVSHFDFQNNSWSETSVDMPGNGAIASLATNPSVDDVFVSCENFLTPPTLYHLGQSGAVCTSIMSLPSRFDADGLEVWQFEVASSDGELIPYFVVAREDMNLNGLNPTVLDAYGGFQISRPPAYMPITGKGWLEAGGVYVQANIRGGGEFGPKWHEAALKENRQKAFDDFAAVARDLIARKITSPRHLGISGGSNGGLLVGVAFTQNPDLFNAVLCDVPLLDMLRFNKLLAGASWMGEYGDPDVPEERAYIEKYSPYQNVDPGATYPRVFFYTSTKDDRVHPGHARKMMARMKEQGHQPLYYENAEGGHGRGVNMAQHARHFALQYTYLWRQLGRN